LIFYLTLIHFCDEIASAIKISAEGQDSFSIDAHSLKNSFALEIPLVPQFSCINERKLRYFV
jgi:hypothetical protein